MSVRSVSGSPTDLTRSSHRQGLSTAPEPFGPSPSLQSLCLFVARLVEFISVQRRQRLLVLATIGRLHVHDDIREAFNAALIQNVKMLCIPRGFTTVDQDVNYGCSHSIFKVGKSLGEYLGINGN